MVNLDKICWNEDFGYYIQIGDPGLATRVGSYDGCHSTKSMVNPGLIRWDWGR
jgi:hypothetical protein